MGLSDLLKATRTYRRFNSSYKIDREILINLINNAHFSASHGNLQVLRYLIYNDEKNNAKIFSTLTWAASLEDWNGPIINERPTAYIIILSEDFSNYTHCDAGISMQTILLSATEKNLGSCIFASIDKNKLRKSINIPEKYEILYVVALGKPIEEVKLEISTGKTKYWRDEKNIHHVPKRKIEDIILNLNIIKNK